MANQYKVFVALSKHGHVGDGESVLPWLFDYFEHRETALVLTSLYIDDTNRNCFDKDVRRYDLPSCTTQKFEAEILTPQGERPENIILELITKHGMTKLVTSTSWIRPALKGFSMNTSHSCKMWCIVPSERKLVLISDTRELQKHLQNEDDLNRQNIGLRPLKENVCLREEGEVFVPLGMSVQEDDRILEWVFENFDSEKTELVITCFYTGRDARSRVKRTRFIKNAEINFLAKCTTRKFEVEILIPDEETNLNGLLLELITKYGMERLVLTTSWIREILGWLVHNPNLLPKIWVIDGDTGKLAHVRNTRDTELVKKENDLHSLKKERRRLSKEIEGTRTKEEIEIFFHELQLIKMKIHYLQRVTNPLDSPQREEKNKMHGERNMLKADYDELQEKQLEGMRKALAIEEEKCKRVEDELDVIKNKAHNELKRHDTTKIELLDISMQLEEMKNVLAIEEEKRKKIEHELDLIKSDAREESKQHEKTKTELLDISMQLKGMTAGLATEKEKNRILHDELNMIKREANDESNQHEKTKNELLDVSVQIKEIQSSLEIEKKRCTELEDELTNVGVLHQQNDSNLLRTFAQLHEAKSSLEIEIKNLKKDLANKGNALQKKDKLHSAVRYGPCMANFSYAELKEATNDFNGELKIGEGGFGSVYRGVIHCTTVAIKILNIEGGQGEKEFNQEVKTLQNVRHPNLITLIGACPEKGALVYEFVPNGSLQDWLGNIEGRKSLSWKKRIQIASETCSALIFLHHFKPHGIAHGDLKPANILLDSNFTCKLSDLGICRQLELTDATSTPLHQTERPMGTRGYMDPDYGSSYEITTHNDVYAFGVILLQLVTGKDAINIKKLVEDALKNKTENEVLDASAEWPSQVAKKMMQLGMRCIHMMKKKRPDLANEVWAEIESMKQVSSSS